MQAKANTFAFWYRILREYNHFSIWESVIFATWLARPAKVRSVHVGNGYHARQVR